MIAQDTKILTHIGPLSVKSISSAKILDPTNRDCYGETQKPQARIYQGVYHTINAGFSRSVIATGEQLFYIRRKDIFGDLDTPQWLPARDIEQGDYICYPIIKAQHTPDVGILHDKNIFYLLGRYAADGYALYNSIVVGGDITPRLTMSLNAQNIESHCESAGLLIENADLWRWCVRHIGNCGKTIDASILCLDKDYLRHFIEGYMDGNSERFDDGIVFIAKSYNMATGLAQCIAKVYGLPTKIRPYTYADNKTMVEYNVIMYTCNNTAAETNHDGIWYEIKDKQSEDGKIKMYDIKGTYIANSLITKDNEKEKYF